MVTVNQHFFICMLAFLRFEVEALFLDGKIKGFLCNLPVIKRFEICKQEIPVGLLDPTVYINPNDARVLSFSSNGTKFTLYGPTSKNLNVSFSLVTER